MTARPPVLYLDEYEIAVRVIGESRASEWPALSVIEERHGLPKIDPLYGGRYWPAVERFYALKNGLDADTVTTSTIRKRVNMAPLAPDGEEDYGSAKTPVRSQRRDRRPVRART